MSIKYKLIAFAVGRMVDMKAIQKALEGWKSYLVCIAAFTGALAGYANGTISLEIALQTIFLALGGITFSAKANRNAKKP